MSCRSLDDALSTAVANRNARLALERELMGEVREALAEVPGLPRATRHAERMSALATAREALVEAEALRDGEQYADTSELIGRLQKARQNRQKKNGNGSR